jgi:isopentenyl-diphosphate delta-isomerase
LILPVIGTGGIRHGLHVAKAIALGASLCGIGLPLLKLAIEGPENVISEITTITEELKVAMLLTGCRTLADLKRCSLIISGETKEILQQRGFNLTELQTRR